MQTDKILHMGVCFALTATLTCLKSWWIAVVVAVAVGILKELVDQIAYKGWDWKDLAADGIGILAGVLAGMTCSMLVT